MNIKPLGLTVLIFFIFLSLIKAQANFGSAIGLRLGYPASVSYKTFVNENGAFEGMLGFRGYGFGNFVNISGAYQVHNTVPDLDGLNWYYGGGASIFFWNYDNDPFDNDFASTAFGIQGYLGLEYTFPDAPINLSLDWVPTLFLGGTLNVDTFGGGFGGIGVRYVLSR